MYVEIGEESSFATQTGLQRGGHADADNIRFNFLFAEISEFGGPIAASDYCGRHHHVSGHPDTHRPNHIKLC